MHRFLKNQIGMSMVEVTMAVGLLGGAAVAFMSVMDGQTKGTNRMEFVISKEQLRFAMIGQFLSSSDSCKCVFQNVTFDKVGVTPAINFANGEIGRYKFAIPGDCSTATVPQKLLSVNETIDNLRALSIQVKNIELVSGAYLGTLSVKVQTQKKVTGSKESLIEIPITVLTAPDTDATKWKVGGCSIGAASGGSGALPHCRLVYEIYEHNGCNGQVSYRHSDWTDEGTAGAIKWTYRDSTALLSNPNAVGLPVATRGGRNYFSADVSCARVGIQCL